jgi:hypothetical protein
MLNKEELLENFLEDPDFGGPSVIDVIVDNGKNGQRGSNFFLSGGNPNNQESPALLSYPDFSNPSANPLTRIASPQRYDVCIDVSPVSPTYLDLFYFDDGAEGLRWYDQIRLTPEGFPLNTPLDFNENGVTVLDLPSVPAPPILTQIIASQAISSTFNLDIFFAQLELLVGKSLNLHYNIVNENAVSAVIYPSNPKPVSISYGFKATLLAGQTTVKLDSGNIFDIRIGQEFFKVSGQGEFSSGAVVTSIVSATEFTLSTPHESSGEIVFYFSNFLGTLSTTVGQEKTVNLIGSNTKSLLVGQKLFKKSGSGAFGENPIITKILSPTAFTISSNVLVSGEVLFGASLPNIDVVLGISALEYNSGTWAPLTGTKTVHLLAGIAPFSV